MSIASLFQSVAVWLARAAPPSFAGGVAEPKLDGSASRLDTFGNPVNDYGAGERSSRDVEDRAREAQILISCWM